MIDQVRSAVDSLRSSRAQHGHAIRQTRRVGVELVRAAIATALPVLAAESSPLPKTGYDALDNGRGFMIVDDRVYDRVQRGHDEWEENEGWCMWIRPNGTLAVGWVREVTPRYGSPRANAPDGVKTIGVREAVRRFGAARIVDNLVADMNAAREKHEAATSDELAMAQRLTAALTALKGGAKS